METKWDDEDESGLNAEPSEKPCIIIRENIKEPMITPQEKPIGNCNTPRQFQH